MTHADRREAGLAAKVIFGAGMVAVGIGAVVGTDDQPANPALDDTGGEHGQP